MSEQRKLRLTDIRDDDGCPCYTLGIDVLYLSGKRATYAIPSAVNEFMAVQYLDYCTEKGIVPSLRGLTEYSGGLMLSIRRTVAVFSQLLVMSGNKPITIRQGFKEAGLDGILWWIDDPDFSTIQEAALIALEGLGTPVAVN